jgi:hypothetical protein
LADTQEFISALEAKQLIRRAGQKESKKSWFARLMRLSGPQHRI